MQDWSGTFGARTTADEAVADPDLSGLCSYLRALALQGAVPHSSAMKLRRPGPLLGQQVAAAPLHRIPRGSWQVAEHFSGRGGPWVRVAVSKGFQSYSKGWIRRGGILIVATIRLPPAGTMIEMIFRSLNHLVYSALRFA